jgi:hemolysin D
MSGIRRHLQVLAASWKHRKAMDTDKRKLHEIEFLPAALEVQQTPPSPVGRAISYIVILFFVIAVAWACIGKVDIVAVAHGKIIPTGKSKVIQPLEIGKVTAIHIKEGQSVKKGDPLIDLDPTSMEADVGRLKAEYQMVKASRARTIALLNTLQNDSNMPDEYYILEEEVDVSIAQAQRDSMISQFEEHLSRKQALSSEIQRKHAENSVIRENIKKHEETIPLITERVVSYKKLLSDNHVARNDYYELEQERIEQVQDLAAFKSQLSETRQAIQQAKAQLKASGAEFKKTIYQEKAQLETQLSGLEKELVKATMRQNLQGITAPVDGVIQQLAIHTIGGVVTPAQELMVIVPDQQQLEAEVFIENKDIGFVEENHEAEIKVDAFPFTKYGMIEGKITNISNDAVENENLGWVFMSRVAMFDDKIQVGEKLVNLTPGMSVTVEVKTGKRRLIEFFLSPLLRYRQESAKER